MRTPLPQRTTALPVALLLATLALTGAASPSSGAPGEAEERMTAYTEVVEAPTGGCADDDGVTVVVDLTDLGGELVAGCAAGDPASGREALTAAGFTAVDGEVPGFVCAIDGLPDPCPTEFTGSYWAYWTAEPDGEWTAYTEGADTTDPAPGALEGWRYNDGATGPGIAPADVVAAAATSAGDAGTAGATDEAATAGEASGMTTGTLVGIAVLVLLLAAAAVVAVRRRRD
ncbi:hypothetical protein [Georgenia faecalis]|uniref:Gram-positive cocci surface proteins LPxTG domain-containing protein n=1 Tax=Georgenia faecalis TaxID=2483799 RepID=A0ABV9D769_9MICO|nr:hypothetical protein [Georgenia faecalis]